MKNLEASCKGTDLTDGTVDEVCGRRPLIPGLAIRPWRIAQMAFHNLNDLDNRVYSP
jgi:hypothetical protein